MDFDGFVMDAEVCGELDHGGAADALLVGVGEDSESGDLLGGGDVLSAQEGAGYAERPALAFYWFQFRPPQSHTPDTVKSAARTEGSMKREGDVGW